MLVEIDYHRSTRKVEVRIIHACTILENGLPYYQEKKHVWENAAVVNGNGGSYAVVKDMGDKSTSSVKMEDIFQILPMTNAILTHY